MAFAIHPYEIVVFGKNTAIQPSSDRPTVFRFGLDPALDGLSRIECRRCRQLIGRHRENFLVEEGWRRYPSNSAGRQAPEADRQTTLAQPAVTGHILKPCGVKA